MKLCWLAITTFALPLLMAHSLLAQSPLLDLQVDPRAQEKLQLQRQFRPVQAPILTTPMEEEVTLAPNNLPAAPTFHWELPATSGLAESYRVCVFEATKACDQPGSESYSVAGSVLELTPNPGLPAPKFLGKTLKWSVTACRQTALQQQTVPGAAPPVQLHQQCASSAARTLYWPLPAPFQDGISRSAGVEPAVPRYTFHWTAVTGARAYLFCLYDGSPDDCVLRTTLRTSNPLIVDKGGTDYAIDYDLPQFRGRTVRWRVAACTHLRLEDRPTSPLPEWLQCTYHQPGSGGFESMRIDNPLLPPLLNPFQAINAPESAQPLVRMSWSLQRAQDVRSVKVCVITARGPGGTPVRPEDRAIVLGHTDPHSSCDLRNVLQNPLRPRNTAGCTFVRPHLDTGDPNLTVFGFAVAVCNEFNQCWYSPLAQIRDQFRPFGPVARCE